MLKQSGLTANSKKCPIGWVDVQNLGFHLNYGQVHPIIDKTVAIAACLRPRTKLILGPTGGEGAVTDFLFHQLGSCRLQWETGSVGVVGCQKR